MKKQGFTLIELLAVIVILAIIALIAVPLVLNIISDAKKSADKRSIDLYAKAIENSIMKYQLKKKVPYGMYLSSDDGKKLTRNDTILDIEYEGNEVVCKNIIFKNDTVYLDTCKVSGRKVDYAYGKIQVTPFRCFETDGEGKITKYLCGSGEISDVIIPEMINGEVITSIGISAFSGNQLTSVVIPSTVKVIGIGAFSRNNKTLVSVIFEEGSQLETIEKNAFRQIPLTEIIIPNSVKTIGENAFSSCKITNIIFEERSKIETIGEYAFAYNWYTTVTIPSSIKSIGANAFASASYFVDLKSAIIKRAQGPDLTVDPTAFGSITPVYQP